MFSLMFKNKYFSKFVLNDDETLLKLSTMTFDFKTN